MKKSSNSRNIGYYLKGKPKIIASLFIALIAVFLVLMFEMSTGNIGHSQIMPANNSGNVIENNNLSSQTAEENMTPIQSAINHTQNSNVTGILSNSPLIKTTATNSTNNLANATKTQSPIPQVKITSHTKNQIVSEGTLSIHGVSSDSPASTCDVYVLLNGIKPYQRVTPTEQSGISNGTKDYSLWKFSFLPTYGLITEGDNKMTAKISCMNGSINATKFNSLNVTGVSSNSTNSNTLLTPTADPLQSGENVTANILDPVQGNSTSLMSTYSPAENVQQHPPAIGGITPQPQTPQTNYYGITPSSSLSDEIPIQNSSITQQEEQIPANNFSVLEEGKEPGSGLLDSVDQEISTQTKKAVDKFIARVQGTVEERLEEAIKMRTPFELVTPTPFDSEDD